MVFERKCKLINKRSVRFEAMNTICMRQSCMGFRSDAYLATTRLVHLSILHKPNLLEINRIVNTTTSTTDHPHRPKPIP